VTRPLLAFLEALSLAAALVGHALPAVPPGTAGRPQDRGGGPHDGPGPQGPGPGSGPFEPIPPPPGLLAPDPGPRSAPVLVPC
jgi:hypothetical protein